MAINAVKILIFNKEHKLLILKTNKHYWTMPGGKKEESEQIFDCLERELKEELPGMWRNLSVCTNYLVGSSQIDKRFDNAIYIGMQIQDKPVNIDNEIKNFRWVNRLSELKKFSPYWYDIMTQPLFRSGLTHVLYYYFGVGMKL